MFARVRVIVRKGVTKQLEPEETLPTYHPLPTYYLPPVLRS